MNIISRIKPYSGYIGLFLILLVTAGFAVWWMMASPGDLKELDPYAAQYAQEALLAKLSDTAQTEEPFTFVVLGDTRNNTVVATAVHEKSLEDTPRFIINTGDLIRGGTVEEYLENYLPALEAVAPIPVFCIPGNHDRGDRRNYAAFKRLFGDTRFSFDYGACRFVGFNACEQVRVSRADLNFLDQELSKPGAKYKYVFFHIPPKYFEREIATDDRRGFAWNAKALRALLARHKVNEVFMGHIHGYASKVIDGVRYTLTAGGGAPFSARLPDEARIFHYLALHVTPNGVSQELIWMDVAANQWRRQKIY